MTWNTFGAPNVARAKQNVERFRQELHDVQSGIPFPHMCGPEEETGDWLDWVNIPTPLPSEWGQLAADTVRDLRASLDYIWHRAMDPTGGPVGPDGLLSKFHLADTEDAFNTAKDGRTGESLRAFEILARFRPWRVGHFDLIKGNSGSRSLINIFDIDNHNRDIGLLRPAWGVKQFGMVAPMSVRPSSVVGGLAITGPVMGWQITHLPIDHRLILRRVPADKRTPEIDRAFSARFDVGIRSDKIPPQFLTESLPRFVQVVENITTAFVAGQFI